MIRPRAYHSAILLLTGKVLIIGGGVADAEIFDPATNSFTAAGSTSSKSVSTATLLASGRVLVTGERTPDGSAAAPSELYDPATGTFTPTGTMATLRSAYTATLLLDGTVLIAGGFTFAGGPTPGSGLSRSRSLPPKSTILGPDPLILARRCTTGDPYTPRRCCPMTMSSFVGGGPIAEIYEGLWP